jgi:hypothetical protein
MFSIIDHNKISSLAERANLHAKHATAPFHRFSLRPLCYEGVTIFRLAWANPGPGSVPWLRSLRETSSNPRRARSEDALPCQVAAARQRAAMLAPDHNSRRRRREETLISPPEMNESPHVASYAVHVSAQG